MLHKKYKKLGKKEKSRDPAVVSQLDSVEEYEEDSDLLFDPFFEEIIAGIKKDDECFTTHPEAWFNPKKFTDTQLLQLLELVVERGHLSVAELFFGSKQSKRHVQQFDFKPYQDPESYEKQYNILLFAIVKNCPRLFTWLVKVKQYSLQPRYNNYIDPFSLAAKFGRLNMLQRIIKLGKKKTPTKEYLRQKLASVDGNGDPVFVVFARFGHIECFKWAFKHSGYSIEHLDFWQYSDPMKNVGFNQKTGKPMFHTALECKQDAFVEFLLQTTPCEARNRHTGEYPIHLAIRMRDLYLVKRLIDNGCCILKMCDGDYPTHLAARVGFLAALQYIVEQRPEMIRGTCLIDVKNKYYENVTTIAAKAGHQDIVHWVHQRQQPFEPRVDNDEADIRELSSYFASGFTTFEKSAVKPRELISVDEPNIKYER